VSCWGFLGAVRLRNPTGNEEGEKTRFTDYESEKGRSAAGGRAVAGGVILPQRLDGGGRKKRTGMEKKKGKERNKKKKKKKKKGVTKGPAKASART